MRRLALVSAAFLALTALASRPATAQCPLGRLSDSAVQHSNPNIAATGLAMAVMPNGDLIAGGRFDSIGGVPAQSIARWDGSTWTPLGAGIQQLPAGACSNCYPKPVLALAVMPNGDLVAAGDFLMAGGVPANNIARWDGANWSPLGPGLANGNVKLAVHPNGNLIAMDSYSLHTWNGVSWSSQTVPIPPPSYPYSVPYLGAIAVLPSGMVVVAGQFNSIGGIPATGIAAWNGTSWIPFGNFVGGEVRSLAVMPNGDLIAGTKTANPQVHRWDGSAWSSIGVFQGLGILASPSVEALAPRADGSLLAVSYQCLAVGGVPVADNGIALWDGGTWAAVDGQVSGGTPPLAIAATPDGFFHTAEYSAVGRWGCRANVTPFGSGCYRFDDTFYETFSDRPSTFDLGDSSLRMTLTATGYTVTPIAGTPAFFTPASPDLQLGDDEVTGAIQLPFQIPYPGGTTNQIAICSNGFVYMQPDTAAAAYYGYTPGLLNGTARHAAFWGDLDPLTGSGSGTVHVDIDTANQTVYATWMDIQEYGSPVTTSTFQIAMSSNGTVEYRFVYGSYDYASVLIGWSPGAGAWDPGSRDLNASGPFPIFNPPGSVPLVHEAATPPGLGTTVTLSTLNIPATTLLGVTVLGWTQHNPGIELSGIGMPSCYQFASADTIVSCDPYGTSSFSIPAVPPFLGVHIYTQGFALVPGVNQLGALSSNGLDLLVGWL